MSKYYPEYVWLVRETHDGRINMATVFYTRAEARRWIARWNYKKYFTPVRYRRSEGL